jgi:acetyl-CoA C-acetyltransferase
MEKLASLEPAFRKGGTITAGNSSGISDGAAALVVTTRKKALERGLRILASIKGYATSGLPPGMVMESPVPAVRKLLGRTGLDIGDVGLVELNEAFAAQSLAVMGELGIDPSRVNVKGGSIALGHPIGASGARILVTLLYSMAEAGARYGLATLCMGGGNGLAMVLENEAA